MGIENRTFPIIKLYHSLPKSHPDALVREERGDLVARLAGGDVGHLDALGRREDVLVVALLRLVVPKVQGRRVARARVVSSLKKRIMKSFTKISLKRRFSLRAS